MRAATLVGLICAVASLAQAEPGDRERARERFKLGQAYQEAGAFDAAIAEYRGAYDLAPLPELLFNIGQCHRLAGRRVEAKAAYLRFIEVAKEGPLVEEAREHVARMEAQGGDDVDPWAARIARDGAAQRETVRREEHARALLRVARWELGVGLALYEDQWFRRATSPTTRPPGSRPASASAGSDSSAR